MKVLMFKPQFALLVEAGQKRQTIRPQRKHPIKAGDKLSLREWTGKPYRSKQRILVPDAICQSAATLVMFTVDLDGGGEAFRVTIDGVGPLSPGEIQKLAELDGFNRWFDFMNWFKETHGLPFDGDLIKW